jgi:hypothetical protein
MDLFDGGALEQQQQQLAPEAATASAAAAVAVAEDEDASDERDVESGEGAAVAAAVAACQLAPAGVLQDDAHPIREADISRPAWFVLSRLRAAGAPGWVKHSWHCAAVALQELLPMRMPRSTCRAPPSRQAVCLNQNQNKRNKICLCAGHEVYVVGGTVRDLLLGGTPKDYDILSSAELHQASRAVVAGSHRCGLFI